MSAKSSESLWGAAIAFIAGVGLVAVVGGVLLASSGADTSPEAPQERTSQKQPMSHAMPVSTGNSTEDCGCGE